MGTETLLDVHVDDLVPTQDAVGMIEVREKARRLKGLDADGRKNFLASRPVPAVRAAGDRFYIVDHHHLARAVHDSGHHRMFLDPIADFSRLAKADFWREMEKQNLVYLFDEHGKAISPAALPKHVSHLLDDPFRSLAGAARKAGAFDKAVIPFAEFKWAAFFRSRITIAPGKDGFAQALVEALIAATSGSARHLPGYKAS